MATIRTRLDSDGKPRYQAIVKRKGWPIVRRTFRKKGNAKTWAEGVEAKMKLGIYKPSRAAGTHTLSEAIDVYLEDRSEQLKPSTLKSHKERLAEWRKALGRIQLEQLTPAMIHDVYRTVAKRASGPTANRNLSVLSVVLEHARRELYWIDSNPCRAVRRMKDSPVRVRFLSDAERDALLEACKASTNPRLYPLVLLALSTGGRQGELLALKWQDVDLKKGRAILGDTKTGRRRVLTIHGQALKLLRIAAKTPHISGFVFADLDGVPRFPKFHWQQAVETAGIEDFRFHDLRHTFASYLAMSGATLAELQAALGHATLTAVTRYAHLSEEHAEDVTRKMVEKWLS